MTDPQDRAESLDDDRMPDEFPPDEPYGVDAYGTTAAEEQWDEPLAERIGREEPDTLAYRSREDASLDLVKPDAGTATDEEAQEIASIVAGDDTTGDTALEREGVLPAELAAIHVIEEE